jgi:hypothetical protein
MKTLTLILLCLALTAQAQNPMTLVAQFEGEGVNNYFGGCMTMGDFDADGMDEFVIGSVGWNYNTGKNYFYQYDSGWPIVPYMTKQGEQQAISYDASDANLSDINGDGLPDLGIPASSAEGGLDIGWLDIYFGSSSFDTLPDWSMHALDTILTYAGDLDSAADVNGDGGNDMVMLNWYIDDPGYMATLEIFYGGPVLDSIPDWSKEIHFCRVAALGDVNADGFADIMALGVNQEPVQIYFGGDPMDTIPDLIFEEYAYGGMGGGVGDVNADGYPDFVLAMHFPDSTFGNDAVYFGGPDVDDVPDVYLLKWTGGSNGSIHGVCSADFNGDGISDIVSASGIPAYGPVIEIYLGGPWFNPVPDALITPWDYYTYSGLTAAMATGDVNGDGRDELLISAISDVYSDVGRVYLFEGPENWTDLGAGVEPEELVRYPGWFKLDQNYPNPFNSSTCIHFELGRPSTVSLTIYDLRGEKTRTLITDQAMPPGGYNVSWNGKNEQNQEVSSGIYLLELQVDQYRQLRKLALLR